MATHSRPRLVWMLSTLGIIVTGVSSRVGRTGFVLVDKYLGDALYAAMVYGMLRLVWRAGAAAGGAAVVMTAIELFQLTGIPSGMLASESWVVRGCARLLGVQFEFLDLLAYGVGIGCIYVLDASLGRRRRQGRDSGRFGQVEE